MGKIDDKLGHRGRLRERFLDNGLESLQDHEVLELLLTYAIPRRDVKPLAKRLLATFGSLSSVLKAREAELLAFDGVGENVLLLLTLFKTIGDDLLSATAEYETRPMVDSQDVINFAKSRISIHSERNVMLVITDARDSLIYWSFYTFAQIQAESFLKELSEIALTYKAKHIWILRYEQSVLDFVSDQETILVNKIFEQLNVLGVIFEDYILFSKNSTFTIRG